MSVSEFSSQEHDVKSPVFLSFLLAFLCLWAVWAYCAFILVFTSNLSFGKLLFISLGCSKIGCKSAVFFTVVFNQELQNVLGQEYWHWFNQHRTSGLEEKDNTFQFEWYYTANWKYFGWYFSFDVAELVQISLMESEQAHKWAKTDNRLHSERNFAYYPPCKRT